jgi:hypothetical protein
MESPIPLPTDNIYKFYALFGLSLFIFCVGASIYNVYHSNETVFQSMIESAAITDTNSPEAVVKKQVLEKRYELAVEDRKGFDKILTRFGIIGMLMMFGGFLLWQFITQPVQDEIAKLQRDKLRYEVEQLKKSGSTIPVKEEPPEESSQPEA